MISSLIQPCLDLVDAFCGHRFEKWDLIRREAKLRIEENGSDAFDTAQQVARFAHLQSDEASTKLWLEVAAEITRQEAFKRRRGILSIIAKR